MCVHRFGVRAQDMRLLFALRRGGAPFAKRPTDLFKATLVTSGAITKQVDRLAKKKLVRRLPIPTIAAVSGCSSTEKGLEASSTALDDRRDQIVHRTGDGSDEAERAGRGGAIVCV